MSEDAASPVDDATIRIWLRDSRPTRSDRRKPGCEERRAAAARSLVDHDRLQKAVGAVRDAEVIEFLAQEMERVRLDANPIQALERFIGARRPRGRPVKATFDRFMFAREVYALLQQDNRMTVAEAVDLARRQDKRFRAIVPETAIKEYRSARRTMIVALRADWEMRQERAPG